MVDFGSKNQLPTEVKILIVEGQSFVDRTREAMIGKRIDIGLTGTFQLRDDCKAVEKRIKALGKGKVKQKDAEELRLAIIRLRTTAGALLGLE